MCLFVVNDNGRRSMAALLGRSAHIIVLLLLPLGEAPELLVYSEHSSIINCFWKLLVQSFWQKTCTGGSYETQGAEDRVWIPRVSHRAL